MPRSCPTKGRVSSRGLDEEVGEGGVEAGAGGVALHERLSGAEDRQPQGLGEHAQGALAGIGDGGFAAEQADGGDLQAGQQAACASARKKLATCRSSMSMGL